MRKNVVRAERLMIIVMISAMPAYVSCAQEQPTPASQTHYFKYPLCFVEEDPDELLMKKIGKVKIAPAPIEHALLIPIFMEHNRQRFVSCPFVYETGNPVVFPKERMPKQAEYKGTIVLCGGYLPTSINHLFPLTDEINGEKCQLIQLSKTRNNKESLRILNDWATLLDGKSFTVSGRFEPLKETNPEKGRYATSNVIRYPLLHEYEEYSVWAYDKGTVVNVQLTPKCKTIVDDFIKKAKQKLQSERFPKNSDAPKLKQAASIEGKSTNKGKKNYLLGEIPNNDVLLQIERPVQKGCQTKRSMNEA